MAQKTLRTRPISVIVLAAVAGAAPVIGGQYPTEGLSLEPGTKAFLEGLFGGGQLALTTHLFLIAPCAGLLAIHALRSRVIQLPALRVLYWLFPTMGLMGCTLLWTKFAFVSWQSWTVWLAATLPLLAVCALAGRVQGPRILVWAVAMGCALAAAKGIGEYAQMRAVDPGWRIFADWTNPNELAVVMLIGLFLSMGLILTSGRVPRLLAGAATILCGLALLLTQSLGSELVGIAMLPCFLALAGFWGAGRRVVFVLVPLALVAALFAATKFSSRSGPVSSAPIAGKSAEAQAQSIAFRVNLWKGAMELSQRHPQGVGIGAYRYYSARPGLTTQTHLAHNTYLQVAVEAGIAGGVFFVGFVVAWLREMLKGAKGLDVQANMLRAAVLCAVVCVLAHSVGDSDLYYPGMAVITFLLMGVGLCLSADGVAPEVMPASLRTVGNALGAAIVVTLGYFAFGEFERASLRGAVAAGDRERVHAITRTLIAAYPTDGETWRFAAAYAPASADPAAKLNFLRRAARLTPSTSNLRALAIAQMERNPADALAPLREALEWDPNNLPTLKLTVLAEERTGRIEDAVATARRLVAVEGTPYFQVRALPQLIPTETFWAREWLAGRETDVHKRIELLQGAVDGYLRYARTTLPQVRQADRTGVPIAGESLDQARLTLTRAREVALELASLYRALGRSGEAGRAEAAAEELGMAAM